MELHELKILLAKYAADSLSAEERVLLHNILENPEQRVLVEQLLEESFLSGEYTSEEPPQRAARLEKMMQQRLRQHEQQDLPVIVSYRRYWIAASIAVLLGAGAYLWTAQRTKVPTVAAIPKVILPGKNGAILQLGDGSEIVLDSMANGVIAQQQGAQVVLNNGQLNYNGKGQTEKASFNTITTPKGRQFRITLSDGSNVWLNAASSMTYPAVFDSHERTVSVTGEAYFEIAANADKPFKIKVNNREQITVLGTRFNVMAYENEALIKTTLVAGSIKVKALAATNDGVIIKPGEQTQLPQQGNGTPTIVKQVDLDPVIAWTYGAFNFDNLSLQEAMRLVERWYDVEVIYENGIPDIKFAGEIDRNVSLNELLVILGKTKLKFRIEDNNKLVILK
ncbi:FecR family protein [Chitinophaga sp. sic0106]|uniref:FecR family protein n=1 Tax=Chitinophaga sp. sic0106 TaxID=2854785 RepID=UPI001C43A7FD|nr:FecR family protein [Chitinophaga sp. sic0106]MBV7533029.1 FecR domain-containing protein [Chitinophaga sp. sic0106]